MSDPREFGAVGDGRADDSEALQHALTQCPKVRGGVELPGKG